LENYVGVDLSLLEDLNRALRRQVAEVFMPAQYVAMEMNGCDSPKRRIDSLSADLYEHRLWMDDEYSKLRRLIDSYWQEIAIAMKNHMSPQWENNRHKSDSRAFLERVEDAGAAVIHWTNGTGPCF
jgi:hypothetical protein